MPPKKERDKDKNPFKNPTNSGMAHTWYNALVKEEEELCDSATSKKKQIKGKTQWYFDKYLIFLSMVYVALSENISFSLYLFLVYLKDM